MSDKSREQRAWYAEGQDKGTPLRRDILDLCEDVERTEADRDAALGRVKELEIRNTSLALDLVAATGRLAKLEALVLRRFEAKTMGDQSQLDVDLYAEGERIAKRRAGLAS